MLVYCFQGKINFCPPPNVLIFYFTILYFCAHSMNSGSVVYTVEASSPPRHHFFLTPNWCWHDFAIVALSSLHIRHLFFSIYLLNNQPLSISIESNWVPSRHHLKMRKSAKMSVTHHQFIYTGHFCRPWAIYYFESWQIACLREQPLHKSQLMQTS